VERRTGFGELAGNPAALKQIVGVKRRVGRPISEDREAVQKRRTARLRVEFPPIEEVSQQMTQIQNASRLNKQLDPTPQKLHGKHHAGCDKRDRRICRHTWFRARVIGRSKNT